MSRASDLANVIASGSTNIVAEGTATTNLQQGLAKGFINFDGAATFDASDTEVRKSLNMSTLTDSGTGHYVIGITSAMGDNDFIINTTATWDSSQDYGGAMYPRNSIAITPTQITVYLTNPGNMLSYLNAKYAWMLIHGDLA